LFIVALPSEHIPVIFFSRNEIMSCRCGPGMTSGTDTNPFSLVSVVVLRKAEFVNLIGIRILNKNDIRIITKTSKVNVWEIVFGGL